MQQIVFKLYKDKQSLDPAKQSSKPRIRDFSSSLTVVPGPNYMNKRPENQKDLTAKRATEMNKYIHGSYYQQVSNQKINIKLDEKHPSYKKAITDFDPSKTKGKEVVSHNFIFHKSEVPL